MRQDWRTRDAQCTQRGTSSAIRELPTCPEHPDSMSFAGGRPSLDACTVVQVAEVAQRILPDHDRVALRYGVVERRLPLRARLVGLSVLRTQVISSAHISMLPVSAVWREARIVCEIPPSTHSERRTDGANAKTSAPPEVPSCAGNPGVSGKGTR